MRRLALILALSLPLLGQNPNTAAFPGSAVTDALLFVATNSSQSTLNASMTNSQTTAVLVSGSKFTAPEIILIDSEILHCQTLTTNTFSACTRGAEGTSATTHSSGATVYGFNDAWHHNQVAIEIEAIETYLKTATTYSQSFTSQTSVTLTHNLNNLAVVVDCYSNASPAVRVYPSTVTLTDANNIAVTFASSQSGNCVVQAGGNSGGSSGFVNTVSFSATPAFNLGLGWVQKITLTANVTSSTVTAPQNGITYQFQICQDGTGSRTFVWPTSFHGAMTIGSMLSTCSVQSFAYDGSAYYATSAGVINQ